MKKKILEAEFGYCPRVLCKKQIVLPIAVEKDLSMARVKVFCPKCEGIYIPRNGDGVIDIDGVYFGTSFPSIFFETYPDLNPKKKLSNIKNIEINENKINIDINELKEKLNQEKKNNNSLLVKINELKKKLNEEISKNAILEQKLNENNKMIKNLENKLHYGENFSNLDRDKLSIESLIKKDLEIEELKKRLSRFPCELKEGEKLMSIIFLSTDQKIHLSVICKNTDKFNKIEGKIYEKKEFFQYSMLATFFTVKGYIVNKYQTIEENKINDNDIIMLNIKDE